MTVVFQHLAAWPRPEREFVTRRGRPEAPAVPGVAEPQLQFERRPRPLIARTLGGDMSTESVQPRSGKSLELPVEELLRRARPLPPHAAMVIDDLSAEEGSAFLAAWRREHPDRYEPVIVGRPASIVRTAPCPV